MFNLKVKKMKWTIEEIKESRTRQEIVKSTIEYKKRNKRQLSKVEKLWDNFSKSSKKSIITP